MKPFDEHFAQNVRETFDNWHEQVPDGAWAKMKNKLGGGNKAKVIPFWKKPARVAAISLVAAATVALLAIPLFFLNDKADSAITPIISHTSEEPHDREILKIEVKPTLAQQESITLSDQTIESLVKRQEPTKPKVERTTTIVADLQKDEAESQKMEILQDPELKFEEIKTIAEKEKTVIAQRDAVEEIEVIEEQNIDPAIFVDATDDNIPLYAVPFEISYISRFSWAISANPLFTFAGNQPNPLPGLSAGVTAGYNLTDRLRLEVGGLLSYNQLDVRNQATYRVVENFSNFLASQGATAPVLLFSGNNKYNLFALEIPVNIQFSVMEGPESRFFVSTGLSSMVYLHQSVSGVNHVHVQNDNSGIASGSASFTSTTIFVDDKYGPFSRIDLGRILNISAGYVFVGKNNSLVLEPFLKLPLGGVSSSNVSLGMGGVSLKLLFSGN